jgi:hypothetical protein
MKLALRVSVNGQAIVLRAVVDPAQESNLRFGLPGLAENCLHLDLWPAPEGEPEAARVNFAAPRDAVCHPPHTRP